MPDSSGMCKLFPCQTTQRIWNRKQPGFKLSTVNISNVANVGNGLPRLYCVGVSFIHLNLNHCVENFWTNSIQLFFNESQWTNADTWKVPILLCLWWGDRHPSVGDVTPCSEGYCLSKHPCSFSHKTFKREWKANSATPYGTHQQRGVEVTKWRQPL